MPTIDQWVYRLVVYAIVETVLVRAIYVTQSIQKEQIAEHHRCLTPSTILTRIVAGQ